MHKVFWATASIAALALTATASAEKIDWRIFTEPFMSAAHAQDIKWEQVDDVFSRKAVVAGDVHRYGFPRTDLSVTLDGVTIKPALALGGWVAFKPMHGGAMVMGDLVLLDSEVNPVMAKMIDNGLEITAVHNHLLRANPETFYMHIAGQGDPVKLAKSIREALAASKTPELFRHRRHCHRRWISIRRSSTGSSASKATRPVACISSTCRAVIPLPKTVWS